MVQSSAYGNTHTNSSRLKLMLVICLGLLLVFSAMGLYAQVLYGSLTGTVTDASGAIVNGAKITALETRTGVSQTASTDSSGIYRFTNILPGNYKVTINAPGFAGQVTNNVLVRVNEVARVDAGLKVASATQEVTVTTEVPLLQTDKLMYIRI